MGYTFVYTRLKREGGQIGLGTARESGTTARHLFSGRDTSHHRFEKGQHRWSANQRRICNGFLSHQISNLKMQLHHVIWQAIPSYVRGVHQLMGALHLPDTIPKPVNVADRVVPLRHIVTAQMQKELPESFRSGMVS
jgi:hypothetical protein